MEIVLPYGKRQLSLRLPPPWRAEWIAPQEVAAAANPQEAVEAALAAPVGGVRLEDFRGARSAAIAINDKTRPVPHDVLLPPLLARLEALGIPPTAITLLIATGAHAPMPPEEFERVAPPAILARYPIVSHDCDAEADLCYLGQTHRGTPAWMNRHFVTADLRIVVGNIEPHQFQGFSGGAKSAVIGLGGRATINANHALLRDPLARPCRYHDNPMRQDVEEIGQLAGIHFALNGILTPTKALVRAIAGAPIAVMETAIPLVRAIFETPIPAPYDLIIVAAGGHPKDINFYQAQKALAHASLAVKEQGLVILVAACPEGVGSRGYEQWMLNAGPTSYAEVFARFEREGFRVGPHKAMLVARDGARLRGLWLVSELAPEVVRRLLLTPASLNEAAEAALAMLPADARIGIMPLGNATVPRLGDKGAEEQRDRGAGEIRVLGR